jgi:hypothetical protein
MPSAWTGASSAAVIQRRTSGADGAARMISGSHIDNHNSGLGRLHSLAISVPVWLSTYVS